MTLPTIPVHEARALDESAMVERVAKAIAPKAWVGVGLAHESRRTASLRHAKAALEALGPVTTTAEARALLLLIRRAVEEHIGSVAGLESEESVTGHRGPELHHEAEALCDAIKRTGEALRRP